jgi:hypothetical protein
VTAFELDTKHRVRERFGDRAVNFYCILFCHIMYFVWLDKSVSKGLLYILKGGKDVGLAVTHAHG